MNAAPSDADPFAFTPVPVRARRDGWTADRQRKFVDYLLVGCGPTEAAQALGLTRQSAFMLRARPGAESFAAAWDAAVRFARRRRAEAAPGSAAAAGREGVLVPRFYRGRLVAVERRVASGGMMRLLAQLDRWAEKRSDLSRGDLLDLLAPCAEPPKRRRRRGGNGRDALDVRFASREGGYG